MFLPLVGRHPDELLARSARVLPGQGGNLLLDKLLVLCLGPRLRALDLPDAAAERARGKNEASVQMSTCQNAG